MGKITSDKFRPNHSNKERVLQMFSSSSNSRKEKGQGLVEYALILVLVAIVVIAALMVLGPKIGGIFSTINGSLSGVSGGSVSTASTGCSSVYSDGYAAGAGYGHDCYSPTYGGYDIP